MVIKRFSATGLVWLWLALLVVVLDQASKQLVEYYLELSDVIPVMPLFNITLAYNSGAAFSFLADEPGWQRWLFTAIALVVSIFISVWLSRLSRAETLTGMALAMILGGAVGNVIDRIVYGHVIDFLDVYVGTHHWPAFNVADSAISVGAVLMILDMLRHSRRSEAGDA